MAWVIEEKPVKKCTCPNCRKTIGYTEGDLAFNSKCQYIVCPECGSNIACGPLPKNLFPTYFYDYGFNLNQSTDEEINKVIFKALEEHDEVGGDYYFYESAGIMVIILGELESDDREIIVTKQWYSLNI